jgi:hypothetical protein
MPGPILHFGATVTCAHGGMAVPTAPNPRVLVSGQPIVTMPAPYTIAGCPFVSGVNPLPCVTGSWVSASASVLSNGQPVLLMDSQAVTAPNGVPLLIATVQLRVIAR